MENQQRENERPRRGNRKIKKSVSFDRLLEWKSKLGNPVTSTPNAADAKKSRQNEIATCFGFDDEQENNKYPEKFSPIPLVSRQTRSTTRKLAAEHVNDRGSENRSYEKRPITSTPKASAIKSINDKGRNPVHFNDSSGAEISHITVLSRRTRATAKTSTEEERNKFLRSETKSTTPSATKTQNNPSQLVIPPAVAPLNKGSISPVLTSTNHSRRTPRATTKGERIVKPVSTPKPKIIDHETENIKPTRLRKPRTKIKSKVPKLDTNQPASGLFGLDDFLSTQEIREVSFLDDGSNKVETDILPIPHDNEEEFNFLLAKYHKDEDDSDELHFDPTKIVRTYKPKPSQSNCKHFNVGKIMNAKRRNTSIRKPAKEKKPNEPEPRVDVKLEEWLHQKNKEFEEVSHIPLLVRSKKN